MERVKKHRKHDPHGYKNHSCLGKPRQCSNLAFDKLLHDFHVGFTESSAIFGTNISPYG